MLLQTTYPSKAMFHAILATFYALVTACSTLQLMLIESWPQNKNRQTLSVKECTHKLAEIQEFYCLEQHGMRHNLLILFLLLRLNTIQTQRFYSSTSYIRPSDILARETHMRPMISRVHTNDTDTVLAEFNNSHISYPHQNKHLSFSATWLRIMKSTTLSACAIAPKYELWTTNLNFQTQENAICHP